MSATLDFLTMTTTNENLGVKWFKKYSDYKHNHPDLQGRMVKPSDHYGYSGEAVEGAIWWGYNPTEKSYIFQAVSGFADDFFQSFYSPLSKVTRIDLAVTAKLPSTDEHLASRHYNKIIQSKIRSASTSRIMTSSQGGSTLYVGSAKSETFGRLYDKGGQMGEEKGNLWRYEVVIRKPRASYLAEAIAETIRHTGFTSATRNMIASYVYKYFLDKGVQPFWKPEHFNHPDVTVSYGEKCVDRKLRWITNQVAPSIAWLIDQGYEREVGQALGLVQLGLWPDKSDSA